MIKFELRSPKLLIFNQKTLNISVETATERGKVKTLKATAVRLDRPTFQLRNLAEKLSKMFNHLAQPRFTCLLACVQDCKRYNGSLKYASL